MSIQSNIDVIVSFNENFNIVKPSKKADGKINIFHEQFIESCSSQIQQKKLLFFKTYRFFLLAW